MRREALLQSGVPSRIVASAFALCAFAIALLGGLSAGNNAFDVLVTAVIAMFVCFVLGQGLGMMGERAIAEAAHEHAERHPIPDVQRELAKPVDGSMTDPADEAVAGTIAPTPDAGRTATPARRGVAA